MVLITIITITNVEIMVKLNGAVTVDDGRNIGTMTTCSDAADHFVRRLLLDDLQYTDLCRNLNLHATPLYSSMTAVSLI